ncbi:MAG TPA: FAD/NAD(P)-binding protein [Steroidobacteraceae bacterium]|nr:FAD/NAD(P)-binding protein [Steroidobacteraceae bacterium]
MQARNHGAVSAAISTVPETNTARRAWHIAIVGAGFSGTALAINLLKEAAATASPRHMRISLVDPRPEIGGGVAYATRDYPYPLNVAAGQMSVDGGRPGDFLDYLKAQGIHASPGDYLPRQVYGDYLRARFAEARAAAPKTVECVHHRASAWQLRRNDDRWLLWLDDGTPLPADDVALALGNPPPATPAELAHLLSSARYVSDPWSIGSLANQENIGSVLLVGSGLTMVDAALRLAALRPRVRHIHVLSRHGWMPEPQASASLPAIKPDVAGALEAARGSTRRLVRAFRTLTESVDNAGGDWREVLALARGQLADQWHALDHAQRARFLRHARSAWDVNRHRLPAGPLSAVRSLARAGILDVHAGRLEEVKELDDAVEVIWRPRGAARTRAWLVDRVINCTGPECRAGRVADPLVQSLLSSGTIRSDALSLGIDIADDGRPVSRDGTPVDRLHYLGPWLRARDWEATAVPELREHAAQLARSLARKNLVESVEQSC